MPAWIALTFLAASAQTLRFMLQRQLKVTQLSTVGATIARFLYAFPLVLILLLAYAQVSGQTIPAPDAHFYPAAFTGAVAQIGGTLCVVALFSQRNFAVGVTFKKTEVLLSVPIGLLWLGDSIGIVGLIAIAIGLLGVLLLSDPPDAGRIGWRGLFSPSAGLGILSGLCFAISAVGYRAATLSLPSGTAFLRALETLAFVTFTQTCLLGAWLLWRDRAEILRVLRAWRMAALVGVFSMLGSVGWFTAFALQQVAYVKALGQIEVALSALASMFVFKEVIKLREWAGLLVLAASVILLIILG